MPKLLSHLSAHVVNRLLLENDFKVYLDKLNNKNISPYGAVLILCLFSLH